MRKHLFFKRLPEREILDRLLECFGIKDFGAEISFTKEELKRINTLEKIAGIVTELHEYYIPCKARVYLENMTLPKCITILRQILRLYSCYLLSNQKMKHGSKQVHYTIMYPDMPSQLRKQDTPCILSFT
jgi:hypothetical protein